ncbi:MAG: outer membrane lipoprotein-sorting protein [Bdellovibrionaceae bacterium]|nr:outer membrane lipoprotein-sorting protein [Bdellovibrionales bacterium]MCB9082730.1 outer membrane lipoprotein-sorting protein [Pseudobdellovibrionaceae bacterium]
MNSIFAKLEKFEKNGRKFSVGVIVLFTLLTILAALQLENLRTHYSFDQFLPADHPLLKQDLSIQKTFNLEASSPYLLTLSLPPDSRASWLTPAWMERLQELTRSLHGTSEVDKVTSLSNIRLAVSDEHSFGTGTLLEIQKQGQFRQDRLPWSLLIPQVLSLDHKHTLVAVYPRLDLSSSDHEALHQKLYQTAHHYFSTARIQVGGGPAIKTEMNKLLMSEIQRFLVLSLLAALAVLAFVVKSPWALVVALLSVALANLFGLGFMAAMGLTFTVLSTTVPVLITVTAVAVSTHTFVRLNEESKGGHLHFSMVFRVLRELALPHLLTAITTAVGFATLLFNDSELIREYGLSVATAVLMSCVVTQLVLAVGLSRLPCLITRDWRPLRLFFARRILQHREILFVTVLSACLLIGLNGNSMNWGARLFDDLPSGQPARTSTEFISAKLGGVIPLEFSVQAPKGSEKFWLNPETLQKLHQLTERWRAKPEVLSALSLADWIRAGNGQGHLPSDSKAVAEIHFLYGMDRNNPLRQSLTSSGEFTRISLRLADLPASDMTQLVHQLAGDIEGEFPGVITQKGGWAATVPEVGQQLSQTLMYGFFQALFWIFVLLCVIFRSVRWALVAVIPNLVPGAIIAGALSITQTPIKPGIALIFAISLGIAFDNTVYILERLKHRLKSKGHLPIATTLARELSPCLASSLSLFAGFSVFLFSYFSINQTFGLFMILSLIAGLIGDLVLLPTVLGLFPRLLGSGSKPDRPLATVIPLFVKEAPSMMKKAAALALITMIGLALSNSVDATNQLTAEQILGKVEQRLSAPNEFVTLKMKIHEADGSNKERTLQIKRKNSSQNQKALVRLLAPSDLRGVSVLTVQEGDEESQWLYLPSAGRSRRITGSSTSSRFLDSDLNYEDFRFSTYKAFNNKISGYQNKPEGQEVVIISDAKKDAESSYSKIKTWINLKHFRIVKSEYYDKDGKPLKVIKFGNYKAVHKRFWRARQMRVENLQTNTTTELTMTGLSTKKLEDSEVSLSALEAKN